LVIPLILLILLSMDLKKLLTEIDELPIEQQVEIYAHIASKLKKREQVLAALEKIKGRGSWDMDAQEYINQLRANDRF
jgi:hypothetical protein